MEAEYYRSIYFGGN